MKGTTYPFHSPFLRIHANLSTALDHSLTLQNFCGFVCVCVEEIYSNKKSIVAKQFLF